MAEAKPEELGTEYSVASPETTVAEPTTATDSAIDTATQAAAAGTAMAEEPAIQRPEINLQGLKATLVAITDGDTVSVMLGQNLPGTDLKKGDLVSLRVAGIRAPETGTIEGTIASQYAAGLAKPGDEITFAWFGETTGGRPAAKVILPGGVDMGETMVHAGFAIKSNSYTNPVPYEKNLTQAQESGEGYRFGYDSTGYGEGGIPEGEDSTPTWNPINLPGYTIPNVLALGNTLAKTIKQTTPTNNAELEDDGEDKEEASKLEKRLARMHREELMSTYYGLYGKAPAPADLKKGMEMSLGEFEDMIKARPAYQKTDDYRNKMWDNISVLQEELGMNG